MTVQELAPNGILRNDLIGRKCKTMTFGQMEEGTIAEVTKDIHTINVKVNLDRTIYWGDQEFTSHNAWIRRADGWGNANFLELL